MKLFSKLFGKATPEPKQPSQTLVDLQKVFPRIKGLYSDESPDPDRRPSQHFDIAASERPLIDNFAKGLGIFYAVDQGHSYQVLQNKHLTETITMEQLHKAALENLAAEVSDKTEIHGDPANILMIVNGGNYEATMLLLDDIWVNIEDMLNDQVCVALPARDLLFATGRNNIDGRVALRGVVRKFFDQPETPGAIVRHIYAREDGKWLLIETA